MGWGSGIGGVGVRIAEIGEVSGGLKANIGVWSSNDYPHWRKSFTFNNHQFLL